MDTATKLGPRLDHCTQNPKQMNLMLILIVIVILLGIVVKHTNVTKNTNADCTLRVESSPCRPWRCQFQGLPGTRVDGRLKRDPKPHATYSWLNLRLTDGASV